MMNEDNQPIIEHVSHSIALRWQALLQRNTEPSEFEHYRSVANSFSKTIVVLAPDGTEIFRHPQDQR